MRGAQPETQAMKKRMIISAGNGIPIMIHCHCISSTEKSAILIVEQQINNWNIDISSKTKVVATYWYNLPTILMLRKMLINKNLFLLLFKLSMGLPSTSKKNT